MFHLSKNYFGPRAFKETLPVVASIDCAMFYFDIKAHGIYMETTHPKEIRKLRLVVSMFTGCSPAVYDRRRKKATR